MCVYCSFRNADLTFDRLRINRREIYSMMGSAGYQPDKAMREVVEQTLFRVAELCRPRYGYALYELREATADAVSVEGCLLHTGPVITKILQDADRCALLVATAGAEFEAWYREEIASGDILREFVASNIGSEIAEATGRVALDAIGLECRMSDWGCGNSYAPGYCGWDVGEQQKLFSLLPPLPCGIRLNASSLMNPIKSVSGIVPVGAGVVKKPYACAICDREDCYKRKKK